MRSDSLTLCREFSPTLLLAEIRKLLANGSLELAPSETKTSEEGIEDDLQVISHLFGVLKASGACRPVINLKTINPFVRAQSFKMEGRKTVADLLRHGDWMTVVDLADAFHHIPLHPEHQRFFRFRFDGRVYQFRAMPFGYRDAPRIFTKVMRVVAEEARALGLRVVVYIDDILVLSDTREQAERDRNTLLNLLAKFGMGVNWEKSQLVPAQQRRYLGVLIDSLTLTLSLPPDRLAKTMKLTNALLKRANSSGDRPTVVHVHQLRQLVGTLQSTADCVLQCRLRLNALIEVLREAEASAPPSASLSPRAVRDLQWWVDHLPAMRKAVRPPLPHHVFDTDASHHGWGAVYCDTNGKRTECQGFFTSEMTSNTRELTGIANGVMTLIAQLKWRNCHARVRTDNQCAMSYVNRMGGRAPHLCRITEEMHAACMKRGVLLTAEYLPGVDNQAADTLSRIRADMSESMLHPSLFQKASTRWGPFTLDAFASMNNCQVPRYVSYRADPRCLYTDFLSRTMPPSENTWAHPPFALVGRLLAKLSSERCEMTILLPHWPSQPWWPLVAAMLIDLPLLLPPFMREGVLHTPEDGAMRSSNPSWSFLVTKLSGVPSRCAAWRAKLSTSISAPSAEASEEALIARTIRASMPIERSAELSAKARSISRPLISLMWPRA